MKMMLGIFKEQRREMAGAALLAGSSLGAAVGLLATSAWLISMASTRPPVLVLEVAIVSVRFFGLSRGLLKYTSRIVEHNSALKIQTSLRIRIYERLSRMLPVDYAALHRGNLLDQIINDVELAQDLWLRVASPWIASLISGSAGIAIIHWLLPACGKVIGLIFLISTFLIPFLAMLASSKLNNRNIEGELFDQVMQIAESTPESLIFNFDQHLLEQIDSQQRKIGQMDAQNASRSGLSSAFYFLALGSAVVISLWYAANGEMSHQLAGINVAVVALLPLAIFDGLSSLPAAFSQLRQILGSIDNIEPMLHRVDAEPEVDSDPPLFTSLSLIKVLPDIEGAHLHEMTANISVGETLLITGRSGSGKSSIISAIMGFVPFTGEILLNGRNLLPKDRALFSTLLQDDYIFGTSIRENLKIGSPSAQSEELLDVLELVELREFVASLPDGLDTLIGPLGFNFSGGEKQRLKLARVLLRKTPLYILDEPYEFLDFQMVERISKRISKKLENSAVIIVSHLPLNIKAHCINL